MTTKTMTTMTMTMTVTMTVTKAMTCNDGEYHDDDNLADDTNFR